MTLFATTLLSGACSKSGAPPHETEQRELRAISRAVFAQDRLWLLQDDGSLVSLGPQETQARAENVSGKLLDICKSHGTVAGLASAQGRWMLERRTGERWSHGVTVAPKGDTLVALGCTDGNDNITLVTNRRLLQLSGTGSRSVDLKQPLQEPYGIGTAFVNGDVVWLGLNAGEWGGGLRRISRRDGAVQIIERNNSGKLCGGPLNSACDPVNGIVSSPWKNDCVVVAVGMVHFMSHGRIDQVCSGNGVRRLYFKALDPQPPHGTMDDGEPSSTISFFGLARTGSTVWAVGIDGLYRFDADQNPQFYPLPRFQNRGGYRVSFQMPGVALVSTDVNQRLSMSGAVPIMAVR